MKKSLILLFLFGAGTLALSLFASSPEAVSANVQIPVDSSSQTTREIQDRSGFDVEVLVDGVPLPEYYARGRNYIEAQQGVEYELRIRNPLGERVAVALAVDGLNSIDARRTSAANASKWVIEPYGTITISGWQMSSNRARRFYFTTERDSYGARIGQTANLGVISAVFFRERRPVVIMTPRRSERMEDNDGRSDNKSPNSSSGQSPDRSNEGAAPSGKSSGGYPSPDDESAATGIGRNMRHDVRWVNMDLEDRATSEVTLRYEYRAGLVRLGIRPYSYPYPDTTRRRESASGFEDRRYSPEP